MKITRISDYSVPLPAKPMPSVKEVTGTYQDYTGVIVTIALGVLLATIGLIPSASDSTITVPTYDFVFQFIIPMAIPLLLFNVALKKIIRESGRLLGIFLIGSMSVAIGAIIATFIFSIASQRGSFKIIPAYLQFS